MMCARMSTTYTIRYGSTDAVRCPGVADYVWRVRVIGCLGVISQVAEVTQHKYYKVTRHSNCQYCGCGIVQKGSGRHKRNCGSKACRAAKERAKRGPAVIRYSRREHIYKIKMARVGCMDCDLLITDETMSVFEMDHRDPGLKVFEVSYSKSQGRTAEEVDNEAMKCDMVCANHHRMRTTANNDIAKGHARFVSTIAPAQITQFASLCDCPEWDVA